VVELLASPRVFLVAVVILGFLPGFILRLIVRLYPRHHPRRDELSGELYSLPLWKRPFFVAEQFETVLFEGLPVRVSLVGQRSRSWLRREWRERTATTGGRIELVFGLLTVALALAMTMPIVAVDALNGKRVGPVVVNSTPSRFSNVVFLVLIWATVVVYFFLGRWMRSGMNQIDPD
jgi:hypothetical protein